MRHAVRRLVLTGLLGALAAGLAWAPARAQVETREGIYLQNRILDLRRQLDNLVNLASYNYLGLSGDPNVTPCSLSASMSFKTFSPCSSSTGTVFCGRHTKADLRGSPNLASSALLTEPNLSGEL